MGETVRNWRLLTLDKSCPDVHVLINLSPFLLFANTSFLSCMYQWKRLGPAEGGLQRTNPTRGGPKLSGRPTSGGTGGGESDESNVQASVFAKHNTPFPTKERWAPICLRAGRPQCAGLQPLVHRRGSRYLESTPVCSPHFKIDHSFSSSARTTRTFARRSAQTHSQRVRSVCGSGSGSGIFIAFLPKQTVICLFFLIHSE